MWFVFLVALAVVPSHADAAREKKKQEREEPQPVFYPDAPEEPRIQFLKGFSSVDDLFTKLKKQGRFRKLIVGEEGKRSVIRKPYGVHVAGGKLFVCALDAGNVQVIDLKDHSLELLGRSPPGRLIKPVNIAVHSDGTRYVVDTSHRRVMVYDAKNRYVDAFGDPEKIAPTDVVIFEDELYVSDRDNGRVVVLDRQTGEEKRSIGRKGSGEGEMFFPTNLAVDPDGNLFVSDSGNARVLQFNSRGDFVRQFGTIGTGPGQFARPKGIALDRRGRIYVVDAAFSNVQIFDRDGNLLLFFGGVGDGPGSLNLPAKVAIDYDHVEFFADWVAPGHEIECLIFVTSQFGFDKVCVYGLLKLEE